ncbi:MAG: hypothetical protein LKJ59_01370, partial [Oscillospiraceae bacterium]|nr:hypothetical protein [Oscillospiraceae bacterium]
ASDTFFNGLSNPSEIKNTGYFVLSILYFGGGGWAFPLFSATAAFAAVAGKPPRAGNPRPENVPPTRFLTAFRIHRR